MKLPKTFVILAAAVLWLSGCALQPFAAIAPGMSREDVVALAAPMRAQRDGDEPLGVALVGPTARVEPTLEALARQLRLACRRMEKVLREA